MKCQHFERRAVKVDTQLDDMMKLWRDVAVAVARADNSTEKERPGEWAAKVVEDYAGFLLAIEKARKG
jgi:hypothetical protein